MFAGVCALVVRERCHRRMVKSSQHFGEFAQPVAHAPRRTTIRLGLNWSRRPIARRLASKRKVVVELLRDRVLGGRGGHHTRRRHNLLAVSEEVVGLQPCEVGQFPLWTPPPLCK